MALQIWDGSRRKLVLTHSGTYQLIIRLRFERELNDLEFEAFNSYAATLSIFSSWLRLSSLENLLKTTYLDYIRGHTKMQHVQELVDQENNQHAVHPLRILSTLAAAEAEKRPLQDAAPSYMNSSRSLRAETRTPRRPQYRDRELLAFHSSETSSIRESCVEPPSKRFRYAPSRSEAEPVTFENENQNSTAFIPALSPGGIGGSENERTDQTRQGLIFNVPAQQPGILSDGASPGLGLFIALVNSGTTISG